LKLLMAESHCDKNVLGALDLVGRFRALGDGFGAPPHGPDGSLNAIDLAA